MQLVRLLLFPISLIYGLVVMLRNMAYDCNVFKTHRFKVPVILVGNLAVGGTGKSPMIAYLVGKLKPSFNIAVLSRGYGRSTKGFICATTDATSEQIGDEPLQLKSKFPDLTVAVCENRVQGISRLIDKHSLILMDDGYQHRAVTPGLSILLFDYTSLFKSQWLLPTGNLREPLSGRKRADIIIVTKTPENITQAQRQQSIARIKPYPHQQLFFSYLEYGSLQALNAQGMPARALDSINQSTHIILLTGIANAVPLLKKLNEYSTHIHHHQYPDHYAYQEDDITKLVNVYHGLPVNDRIVITTEKDMQRLKNTELKKHLNNLSIYYIPVQMVMHQPDQQIFDGMIEKFAGSYQLRNDI